MFDRATLKLTAVYTAILMVISLAFSVAIFTIATREIGRPLAHPTKIVMESPKGETFERIFRERTRMVSGQLAWSLVFINVVILISGAAVSYVLARLTMKPIKAAFDRESRFVSDASHELRTPLAAMKTENEVLLRDKSVAKSDLRAALHSNLEEVDKLRRLTDYLLQMNSTEPIAMSDVDLVAATATAVERVKTAARARKITIDSQIAGGHIRANAEAVTSILAILLDNAVKYSPDKTTVVVGRDETSLFVRDNGSGVAATDLPHIFERFYRAEKSRTTDGYGLGLALAQDLAAKMNMKITARNNDDGGATFGLDVSYSSFVK
jgi:signal transduction histidine kinase